MNKLTDKQRQEVFQQDAVIKLGTVFNVLRCLDTASTRGAFKANELTFVGNIHDMLASGINKAFEAKIKETQTESKTVELNTIPEDKSTE